MTTVLALWLALPAAAGGWHAGIAIADLQALHQEAGAAPQAPSFGSSQTGWSLIVPGGIVFVYVAPDTERIEAWLELQLSRQRQAPVAVEQPPDGVDAAWRRGTDFALVRDGNVGIMVQGTEEATEEAALVRGLVQDAGPPWPAPPVLVPEADGSWSVLAPGAVHTAWQGGRRLPGPGLRFAEVPDKLVAWDALGRAAVAYPSQGEAPQQADPP